MAEFADLVSPPSPPPLSEQESMTLLTVLKNRTVEHPDFLQTDQHIDPANATAFKFVIGADTQLGIGSGSKSWDAEMAYSERAVAYINNMSPRPAFVNICGDLVDMEPTMFESHYGSRELCKTVQDKQYDDFKRIWSKLHKDIPIICLCGNHDVGNRPTRESIMNFKSKFGDDYFSFWCNGCFNICLNTNIYFDYTSVADLHAEQHSWLESQLNSVRGSHLEPSKQARRVFIFGHHPWFLFDENETKESLIGMNQCPGDNPNDVVSDIYFPICLENRKAVLELCQQYRVDACFAGHYHQNLVGKTSFGMPMVTTAGICGWQLLSSAKDTTIDGNKTPGPGIRVVTVADDIDAGFAHCYECI